MGEKKTTKVKTRSISLVRQIALEQKTCPQCGKTFERAKSAKFCSTACANNASYARNAEAYRAARREKYRAAKNTTGKK